MMHVQTVIIFGKLLHIFWQISYLYFASLVISICSGDGCHLIKPTVILKLEKTGRKMKWDKSLIWKSWFDRYELQLVSLVVLDMDNIPIFAVSVMCPLWQCHCQMHNNGFHSNFNLGSRCRSNDTTNKLIVSVLETQLLKIVFMHPLQTGADEHLSMFWPSITSCCCFLGSGRGRGRGSVHLEHQSCLCAQTNAYMLQTTINVSHWLSWGVLDLKIPRLEVCLTNAYMHGTHMNHWFDIRGSSK